MRGNPYNLYEKSLIETIDWPLTATQHKLTRFNYDIVFNNSDTDEDVYLTIQWTKSRKEGKLARIKNLNFSVEKRGTTTMTVRQN